MARLLKINNASKTIDNNIGDIIGVFEDSHIFDVNEVARNDIEDVLGTRLEVRQQMNAVIPERKMYFLNSETSEFEEMKSEPNYEVGRVNGEFVDNILKTNKLAVSK